MGEQVFPSSSPLAALRSLGVVIPIQQQFVVDGSENFRVRIACSLANVTVTLQARLLLPDGSIQPIAQTFNPIGDRSINTFDVPIGVGALLSAVLYASAGAPVRGQCFAQLGIIQGLGASAIPLGTLLQGYITSFQTQAWPGSPLSNSFDGQGWQHLVLGTQPPPNTLAEVDVPSGARWEVRAAFIQLTTTAAAGTRFPFMEISRAGTPFALIPMAGAPGPNWIANMTFVQGVTFTSLADGSALPTVLIAAVGYPNGLRLFGGDQIFIAARELLAGDQFSAPALLVEEWLELN